MLPTSAPASWTASLRRCLPAGAALLAALVVASPLAAQSLADIAAREDARRKRIAKPSRLYTNKDIKPADRPEPAAATPAGAQTPAEPAASEPGAAPATAEGAPDQDGEAPLTEEEERGQQEQLWRSRMAEARAALERSQMFAEALQSRINALWVDFTARDDPAQRSVIEAERRKALAQLDRVKAEIVAQTKAIADIEEEARRAGIPPGWLR